METKLAERMLEVIRSERDARLGELRRLIAEDDHPYAVEAADHEWVFHDRPFVNELCLLLMVWLRHEVERDLVRIAARLTDDGKALTADEHDERIEQCRKKARKGDKGWKQLAEALDLDEFEEWRGAMETLRLVGNLYKHDPWSRPDEALLSHLRVQLQRKGEQLRPSVEKLFEHLHERAEAGTEELQPFQGLAESPDLMLAMAASLDLEDPADYCDVTAKFLALADGFLREVRERAARQMTWSPVKPRLASSDPTRMAR